MNGSGVNPRQPLGRRPDFIRLWTAQSISSVGARISREGLPLAAVLLLHAGPGAIGLLAAVRVAPAIVLGLVAGDFVDRASRRWILIGADFGRAATLALVPIAAFTHHLTLAGVLAAAGIVGALGDLFDIADRAYLPGIVDAQDLLEANGKLATTDSIAEIAGPSLAGALVSALTAPIAILFNVGTYLVSGLVLLTIRTREKPTTAPDTHRDLWSAMAEGFKVCAREPLVRPVFLTGVTSSLFGGFFSALYIVFLVRQLSLSPALLGVTVSVGGVGALVGAWLAGRLGRRMGIGPAYLACGIASGLFALLIPLAGGGLIRSLAFLMMAQFLGDAVGTASFIYGRSIPQAVLSNAIMGRVGGAFAVAGGIATTAGALAGGQLGGLIGTRPTLFIACAGLIAAPLWILASPLAGVRALPGPADQPA